MMPLFSLSLSHCSVASLVGLLMGIKVDGESRALWSPRRSLARRTDGRTGGSVVVSVGGKEGRAQLHSDHRNQVRKMTVDLTILDHATNMSMYVRQLRRTAAHAHPQSPDGQAVQTFDSL